MTDKPWWKPRKPVEIIEKPWLHDDVIDYLSEIVRLDMRIAEQGSGGSTLWFSKRARSVISFEHDYNWYVAVKLFTPINTAVVYWPNAAVMPCIPYKVDLVFIDGEHKTGGRRVWIENARSILNPGGWLVLDNANRPEYAGAQQTIHQWATREARFDRNENGSKFFITEFWKVSENQQEPITLDVQSLSISVGDLLGVKRHG